VVGCAELTKIQEAALAAPRRPAGGPASSGM
jgi:hypothetical protein